jgi:hypothetical protein
MWRRVVRGLGRFEYGCGRLDQRDGVAVRVASRDRPDLNLSLQDPPASIHFEPEIDDSEMAAPETRHDSRLAVDGPALSVAARQTGKILAGKQQVLMAQEQRINAAEPGEVLARVLLPSR